METFFSSSSLSSPIRPNSPFPATSPHRKPLIPRRRKSHAATGLAARRDSGGGGDSGGWLVDEDMIVLRKRLHEMKMVERNYEPPSDWMDWEKRIYTSYDAGVCEAVGLLQALVMNTRPSVALGMLALVMLSLPTSAAVVVIRSMEVINMILSGVLHLS